MDLFKIVDQYVRNKQEDESKNNQEKMSKKHDNTAIDIDENSDKELQGNIIRNTSTQRIEKVLPIIVDQINLNLSIENMALSWEISPQGLKDILYINGYYYIDFLYSWHKKSKGEIIEQIISELNAGKQIYDIASKYGKDRKKIALISGELIPTIQQAGYKQDNFSRKWFNEMSDKNRLESEKNNKVSSTEINNIEVLISQELNHMSLDEKNEMEHQEFNRIDEAKITDSLAQDFEQNLPTIVKQINNDGKFDMMALKYDMSLQQLKEILLKNGYQYIDFLYSWHKESKEEKIKQIISELNNKKYIYDIACQYGKDRKDIALISGKLLQVLQKEGYKQDKRTKKWNKEQTEYKEVQIFNNGLESEKDINAISSDNQLTNENDKLNEANHLKDENHGRSRVNQLITDNNIKNIENQLEDIVMLINDLGSMKEVAEKFLIDIRYLKTLLKKNEYRYDFLLDIWTKKDRITLLKETSQNLLNGEISLNTLQNKGINIEELRRVFSYYQLKYDPRKVEVNSNLSENAEIKQELNTEEINAEITASKTHTMSTKVDLPNFEKELSLFTVEEQKALKQISNYWISQTQTNANISVENTEKSHTFVLNNATINKINLLTNVLDKTAEEVISKSIEQFLEKIKLKLNETDK